MAAGGMMTKSSFDAIKTQYGDKICALVMDNEMVFWIRYGDPTKKEIDGNYLTMDDITAETVGDTDFLVCTRKIKSQGGKVLTQKTYSVLSQLHNIVICDMPPEQLPTLDETTHEALVDASGNAIITEKYWRLDPRTIN